MIHIHSFVFSPFTENTYILSDETQEAVIIDPGCNNTQEENTLHHYIETNALKVVKLLNTHCHIDHVFGNQFIKDTYGVQLYMHRLDIPTLKANKMVAQMYGIVRFVESEPDVFVEEGDTIEFGNSQLEVLFVPGHAPGHVVFLNRAQKFAISGDVLFQMGIGRYDFPGCSYPDLMHSIRHKLFLLEEDLTVYPGHGPTTTIGFEKINNPFLK
ncbi:MAG: MBL fold metallo-hydrolase [Microscillaceae bacterium]|nr:MBL fold metallo-hydrolase [Microscillaceae bacterium]